MKLTTQRFKDADWLPIDETIIVIGAGGIGSPLIVNLVGMDVKRLIVFDHDHVGIENIGTQLHFSSQIGNPKVDSIKYTCEQMYGSSPELVRVESKFDLVTHSSIMICAVDDMDARRSAFETWKKGEDRELFIDGRTSAETLWVYCVLKGNEEEYEKYLLSNDEIPTEACTLKATRHIGALCSGFMIANLTNYLRNKKLGAEISPVNFRTEFQIPLGYVEIQETARSPKNENVVSSQTEISS